MRCKAGILALIFSCLMLYSVIYNLRDKLLETYGPLLLGLVFVLGIGAVLWLFISLINWIIGGVALIFCTIAYRKRNKKNILLSIISICICGLSILCSIIGFNETKFARPSEEFKQKEIERISKYVSQYSKDTFVIDEINYDFSQVDNNESSFPWYGKSKNRYVINLHKSDDPNLKLVLKRTDAQDSYSEIIQIDKKTFKWPRYYFQKMLHELLNSQTKAFGDACVMDIHVSYYVDNSLGYNGQAVKNMGLDDYMGLKNLKDEHVDIIIILCKQDSLTKYSSQIVDLCKYIDRKALKKVRLNIQLYDSAQEQVLREINLSVFSDLRVKNMAPKEVCVLNRDEIAKIANGTEVINYISDLSTFLARKK